MYFKAPKRSCGNCKHGRDNRTDIDISEEYCLTCKGLGWTHPLWATKWTPLEPRDCEKCEERNCNDCIK